VVAIGKTEKKRRFRKHYAPIHPGTGTDMSVHDPGGGGGGGKDGDKKGGDKKGEDKRFKEAVKEFNNDPNRGKPEMLRGDDGKVPTGGDDPGTPDGQFEQSIRPQSFDDYIGNEDNTQKLRDAVIASKESGSQLPHTVIGGPSGTGKTTLARIIGNEIDPGLFREIGATSVNSVSDMGNFLSTIEEGEIIFIDEIHGLNLKAQEVLYPALEDFKYDIDLGEGIGKIRVDLPQFTLIGATTRLGDLKPATLQRFPTQVGLEPLEPSDLSQIVDSTASKLGVTLEPGVSTLMATRAQGVPRIANQFVGTARNFGIARDTTPGSISMDDMKEVFRTEQIDSAGLNKPQRKYLRALKSTSGTTGVGSLSSILRTPETTIVNTIEPYLLEQSYAVRGRTGRTLTERGKKHLETLEQDNVFKRDDSPKDPADSVSAHKTDGDVAKHMGPGPHPGTGTPQSIHGGGGGTSSTDPQLAGAKAFYTGFAEAKAGKYGAFLNDFTEDDFAADNVEVYTSNDGKVGAALTDHGDGRIEVGSLYALPGAPSGQGRAMLRYLIKEKGANWLNNFDGPLTEFYIAEGFEVETRDSWNDEFAPADWDYNAFGTPDYVTMGADRVEKHDSRRRESSEGPDLVQDAEAPRQRVPSRERQIPGGPMGVRQSSRDDRPGDGPDFLKHGGPGPNKGTGTPQSIHGRKGGTSPTDSPADRLEAVSLQLNARGQVLEPGITQTLQQIAQPGDFRKLEFKLKTADSISDKIQKDMLADGLTLDEAADGIHDLNRYTLVWDPDEEFWEKYETVNERLGEQGWSIFKDKDKNAFASGDYYQGLNVQYEKGGTFMEIQYHTPDTYAVKQLSEPLYISLRQDLPEAKRIETIEKIFDLYNPADPSSIQVPPNFEDYGTSHVNIISKIQLASRFMKRVDYWIRAVDKQNTPLALLRLDRDGLLSQWDVDDQKFIPSLRTRPEMDGLGGSSDFMRVSDKYAIELMATLKKKFTARIKVAKTDEHKNLVFGWASVAVTPEGDQIIDRQGHAIDVEDLENTAYDFTVQGYGSGDMHQSEPFGELVESMVLTKEKAELMGIPPGTTPEGWWVGFRVPPEYHKQVREGERTMFSIEGSARLEPFDS